MTSGAPYANELEKRFSARPHVGVVTHFEGLDLPTAAERVRSVMSGMGLSGASAIERLGDEQVFNGTASVPIGEAMEIWVIATEMLDVGVKLETRVFHRVEDSALADEYLVAFAKRLANEPSQGALDLEGEDHVGTT